MIPNDVQGQIMQDVRSVSAEAAMRIERTRQDDLVRAAQKGQQQ